MVDWTKLTAQQHDEALSAFTASTLRRPVEGEPPEAAPVLLSDVVSRVLSASGAFPADIAEALLRNPGLRQAVRAILARKAQYHGARIAAASTGKVDVRPGDGFTLSLIQSEVEPEQIYIVIELKDPNASRPSGLRVLTADGRAVHADLPEFVGDRCRLVEPHDSDLVEALRDGESDVFLN